eukprot:8948191-Lingulodinium_polyedra.AAC.1
MQLAQTGHRRPSPLPPKQPRPRSRGPQAAGPQLHNALGPRRDWLGRRSGRAQRRPPGNRPLGA